MPSLPLVLPTKAFIPHCLAQEGRPVDPFRHSFYTFGQKKYHHHTN
jgi:hypothetical protein